MTEKSRRPASISITESLEIFASSVGADRIEFFRSIGHGNAFHLMGQFPESPSFRAREIEVPANPEIWAEGAKDPIIEPTEDGKCRVLIPVTGRTRRLGLLIAYFDSSDRARTLCHQLELAHLIAAVQDSDDLDTTRYLVPLEVATNDSRQFLTRLAEVTRPVLGADRIVFWLADKTVGKYEAINPPSPFGKTPVYVDERFVKQLSRDDFSTPTHAVPWADDRTLRLARPIYTFEQLAGFMEFQFPPGQPTIDDHVRRLALDVVENCCRALEFIERSSKLSKLNRALSKVAQAQTIDDLVMSLEEGASSITGCEVGAVLLLDSETGRLDIARCRRLVEPAPELSMDKGVTGQCLRNLKAVRLGDVTTHKLFLTYWPGIRSELAVPLCLPDCSARVPNPTGAGTQLSQQPKPIGVLNVESPLSNAFSQFDEECMTQLAATAAVMFDRLHFGDTLSRLHDAESELAQDLAGGEDWLVVVKKVGDHIIDALAYTHLNISIVSTDGKRIKSEYIWWDRSEEDTALFKKLSDHDLVASPDIQADVARTKQIEVPNADDPRFHPDIHYRFGLDKLIRVYIPLMMGDVVVGTLEAGYRRRFRQYIFERDIQILKALSDYAAAAVWKRTRGQLDILRHEIAAPRKAIMDDSLFLKRNWRSLSPEKIGWKLDDIFLDGSTIDYLLDKIEYYISGRAKETKPEFCNVGATVITKTILQQNRLLRSLNLNLDRISYSGDELTRVRTVVDKVKAGEVFTNLLGNAIKYRKSDDSLQIRVAVEARPDRFIVRIADDGIGIDAGYESRIFDEGVRGPAAIAQAQGSGLGLWLARQYMRDMGGDIRIENPRNPTVFCVEMVRRDRP